MKFYFTASFLSIEKDENGILIIGIANNEDYDKFITIQYSDELDDQDKSFKWTNYYLELSNGKGSYNCLEKIQVSSKRIDFILNEYGQQKLGVELASIENRLSAHNYINLISTLKQIFLNEKTVSLNIED